MPEELEKPEKNYSWKGSANAGRVVNYPAPTAKRYGAGFR